ncbi:hypothetical protein [Agrobacterium rosae]|uniref:hypothetical protein n=1 Tax=Agrobacterium rosae TaxID=1972867 RepID=UPI0020340ABD|nr:hypothetical protein [Agrobacterium rosae]MCM2435830.1 hypothetical protein [Agrobacterium rosae]
MSPSDNTLFPFVVQVIRADRQGEDTDYNCQITVFDGRNMIREVGTGWISTELPRGLYVVRLVSAGSMAETVVVHEAKTEQVLTAPMRSSALPTSDARESHEYYSGPAQLFSQRSTAEAVDSLKGSSRLMIMFRGREKIDEAAEAQVDFGMLQTPNGEIVSCFGGSETVHDVEYGWSIFSCCLKPGPYLLIKEEEGGRIVMPIYLFEGWDSLMFVPVQKRVHFERASLDIVPHNAGFDPTDDLSQKVDAAIQVLGKHFGTMPDDIRIGAVYNKFKHPLAGLIGACAHFQSNNRDDRLENTMLRNLWKMMPGSPDVIGLLFLSWSHRGKTRPKRLAEILQLAERAFGESVENCFPLAVPPMLRPTLDAIVLQSQETPDLIEARSWLETASLSDYAAGPWAIFDGSPMLSFALDMQSVANPLSHQKLYPIVKNVFSHGLDLARRADWEISKNATIKSIADTPVARELGRTELGARLRELQVEFFPDLVAADDTVADVVSKIRDQGEIIMQVGVSSSLPPWLLDMANKAVSTEDMDTMARNLARQARVPLRVASAALELARSSGALKSADGTTNFQEMGG